MKKVLLVSLLGMIAWACTEDDAPQIDTDNFDRKAMLTNWTNNIIIPGYQSYISALNDLTTAKNAFIKTQSANNLSLLRTAWLDAYMAWQKVSMFEIGKAEQLTLRDFTNIFPTNADDIETNISSGTYNLELPSTRDQQGFPALDYLLYGSAENDDAIVARFTNETELRNYLDQLVNRLQHLGQTVLNDWQDGYSETFINNDGSESSSSVNKLVNDFMLYYEKALRAGKIGIPAGVFSSVPLSDKVEAYYAKTVSKQLFETALQASVDFFNGKHFNSNVQGESLKTYLEFVNAISDGESLSALINNQFNEAFAATETLNDNFTEQIETYNQSMLATYDELQVNVVLLKVDMFQALNVKVDFVDADGD